MQIVAHTKKLAHYTRFIFMPLIKTVSFPDFILAAHLPWALLPEGETRRHVGEDPVRLPLPRLHRRSIPGELGRRGPFLTSPLAPRGDICSLRGMFTPSFTPRGEHSLLFRKMEGRTEDLHPRGTKFTPGGQLRQSLPIRAKLRVGLRVDSSF
jgi:hypothetical protein